MPTVGPCSPPGSRRTDRCNIHAQRTTIRTPPLRTYPNFGLTGIGNIPHRVRGRLVSAYVLSINYWIENFIIVALELIITVHLFSVELFEPLLLLCNYYYCYYSLSLLLFNYYRLIYMGTTQYYSICIISESCPLLFFNDYRLIYISTVLVLYYIYNFRVTPIIITQSLSVDLHGILCIRWINLNIIFIRITQNFQTPIIGWFTCAQLR